MPPVSWSLKVGDLRPALFLAQNVMQVLHLLRLQLDRRRSRGTALLWAEDSKA